MISKPTYSFVIPAKNEQGNITLLWQEIIQTAEKNKLAFEIIFIDDGSTDETFPEMIKIHNTDKRVKIIKHRGNWGKATALKNGFEMAQGDIVFTMDADLQDNAAEIPNFIKEFDLGYDLVIGWKKRRLDPLSKVLSSRIYNWVVSITAGTSFHDINCGFKAYRHEVVQNINFGELFRLIPVLAAKQNYKVKEIIVNHRPRKFGASKFGFERGVNGGLDLITVIFLTGFVRKPAQFFGLIGLISGLIGFTIGLYITYLRITTGGIEYRYPLLFLGVLLIIVGVQFISTGLLAEMILYFRGKSDHSSAIAEVIS